MEFNFNQGQGFQGGFNFNQANMNMGQGNDEFMKICSEHIGCENCPLLDKKIVGNGVEIICNTGMEKNMQSGGKENN